MAAASFSSSSVPGSCVAAVAFRGFVAHPLSPVWLEQEDPSPVTMAPETTLESQGGLFSGGGVSIKGLGVKWWSGWILTRDACGFGFESRAFVFGL